MVEGGWSWKCIYEFIFFLSSRTRWCDWKFWGGKRIWCTANQHKGFRQPFWLVLCWWFWGNQNRIGAQKINGNDVGKVHDTDRKGLLILVMGLGVLHPCCLCFSLDVPYLFFLQNLADPRDSAMTPWAKMHVIFLMHVFLAHDDKVIYSQWQMAAKKKQFSFSQ